jgi:CRP/FNR family transcriptional regulator, cyclic AMP receptor protein
MDTSTAESTSIALPFLQEVAVFGALIGASLETVAGHLQRRVVPAGAAVFSRGERASELYIVEEGTVDLLVGDGRHGDPILGAVGRGGCLGESAFLEVQPHGVSARARTDTTLLVLRYRDLLSIHTADSQAFTLLVMNLAREVARRLRQANELLARRLGRARRRRGARKRVRRAGPPPGLVH